MLQELRRQITKTTMNNDIVGLNIINISGELVLPIKRIDTNTWVLMLDKKEQVIHLELVTEDSKK